MSYVMTDEGAVLPTAVWYVLFSSCRGVPQLLYNATTNKEKLPYYRLRQLTAHPRIRASSGTTSSRYTGEMRRRAT